MRIDPNQFLGNLQSDNVQPTNGKSTQPAQADEAHDSGAVDTDDQFQPSQTLDFVQRLKTQLARLPEIRSDRVSALGQKIQQGTYAPSNDQIAGAMISELGSSKRS